MAYTYARESAYRLKVVEREIIDEESVPVNRQILSRNEIEERIARIQTELADYQAHLSACDDLEIIRIPEQSQP